MKKFILKSILFTAPFLLFYLLNAIYYIPNKGDLTRLGYLYDEAQSREDTFKGFYPEKKYTVLSELNLDTENSFDVFTIGDSFSEQGLLGYKNFLAENHSLLHMDRFLSGNPVQKLIELINGDFFEKNKFNYVILQSVERVFVQRTQTIDSTKAIEIEELKKLINNYEPEPLKTHTPFFSDATLKVPITNVQYLFNEKPKFSQTYNVKTVNSNLFSGHKNNLLFFEDDINYLSFKNDSLKVLESNILINKISEMLSKKNIKLLLLISPDKYDLYYPEIKNKNKYERPLFFKYYNELSKDYLYINSLEVLNTELKIKKDVYYFDDTHWSPIGVKAITLELNNILKSNGEF